MLLSVYNFSYFPTPAMVHSWWKDNIPLHWLWAQSCKFFGQWVEVIFWVLNQSTKRCGKFSQDCLKLHHLSWEQHIFLLAWNWSCPDPDPKPRMQPCSAKPTKLLIQNHERECCKALRYLALDSLFHRTITVKIWPIQRWWIQRVPPGWISSLSADFTEIPHTYTYLLYVVIFWWKGD